MRPHSRRVVVAASQMGWSDTAGPREAPGPECSLGSRPPRSPTGESPPGVALAALHWVTAANLSSAAATARPAAGPCPRRRPGLFLAQLRHPPPLPHIPHCSRDPQLARAPRVPPLWCPKAFLSLLGLAPGALDGRMACARICVEGLFRVLGIGSLRGRVC